MAPMVTVAAQRKDILLWTAMAPGGCCVGVDGGSWLSYVVADYGGYVGWLSMWLVVLLTMVDFVGNGG